MYIVHFLEDFKHHHTNCIIYHSLIKKQTIALFAVPKHHIHFSSCKKIVLITTKSYYVLYQTNARNLHQENKDNDTACM